MVIPGKFEIHSPAGRYFLDPSIDMNSLCFSIVCKPASFKRKMIQFINTSFLKDIQTVYVILIERNPATTYDVVPLKIKISFVAYDSGGQAEENLRIERIKQFGQFIDQFSQSGEFDYLNNKE